LLQWTQRQAAMNNGANGWLWNGDETYAFPDGFSSYDEYYSSGKLPPSEYLMQYEQWYLSLGFSTGYRWPTFLGNLTTSGGVRAGLIRNNYDDTLYRPFDPSLRENNNAWTPKDSLWANIALDQRDIYYDPSKGYYLSERFGVYGILDTEREHYLRSDTKAELYFTLFNIPITDKWNFKSVLGFHSGLSFVFKQPGYDRGALVPVIEQANMLAVDGMFTGRGWSNEYRVKGLALWENWAELRFPLVPGMLAWDFFFDAAGVESVPGYYFGTNDKGNPNFNIDNMRFSFGAGLRLTLPQLPFRFSLAKRFRTQDGEFIWEKGSIPFGDPNSPGSGIDPVISFAISY
jgi:outer membrane protein insertion porin family